MKRRICGHPVGYTDPPDGEDAEHPGDTANAQQNGRTPAKPPRTTPAPRECSSLDPDHPAAFRVYTIEELDAQVRRRPIGRTIIEICNDLGVIPTFCDGGFWSDLYNALWWYGGSFTVMSEAQKRREKAFGQERSQRPDAWDWDWRDSRVERVRRALGCLIGEAPMLHPPGPRLAPAPP